MKKILISSFAFALALSAFAASAAPSPAVLACRDTFLSARQTFILANRSVQSSFASSIKSSVQTFIGSDRGPAARDAFQASLKSARDAATAQRLAAQSKWMSDVSTFSACMTAATSASPSPTPIVTPTPNPSDSPSPSPTPVI
jgi:hypothetical protein